MFQLLLLKLVTILFPTSDFRHAVTTPAIIFVSQMLAQVGTSQLYSDLNNVYRYIITECKCLH